MTEDQLEQEALSWLILGTPVWLSAIVATGRPRRASEPNLALRCEFFTREHGRAHHGFDGFHQEAVR